MNELETLNEALPKRNDIFTIDPFTSISQYNEALHALENNKIGYREWISTFTPYDFYLSTNGGEKPIMVNYDTIGRTEWIKVVSKVQPLTTNDVYLLYRRPDKQKNIDLYINNDVFRKAKKSNNIVFDYKNKEQLGSLSKSYGPIYPLGHYMNGRHKLAISFNKNIKNVLMPSDILLEIGSHKDGELEVQINYKIFRNQDKLEKWSKTPYFDNGKFHPISPTSPLKI